MIDDAIEAFKGGVEHNFHGSRDYDLLLTTGERLPPKAIFGIALSRVIGRPATPTDFSAGWGEPSFDIVENAGYPIIPKGEVLPPPSIDPDDERTWAEGSLKRVQHLRRERAPGIAIAKKRRFLEFHGHLFCERCELIPSQSLGPLGDACIEVHHRKIAVSEMDGETHTRLEDLQCLCANCHRIVHREQL
jgi:5-methylcytosine-specific restriction protein A